MVVQGKHDGLGDDPGTLYIGQLPCLWCHEPLTAPCLMSYLSDMEGDGGGFGIHITCWRDMNNRRRSKEAVRSARYPRY